MIPKFRLANVRVPSNRDGSPTVLRKIKLDYAITSQPRCDMPPEHCYGCDSAEPKKTQEDIYKQPEAA